MNTAAPVLEVENLVVGYAGTPVCGPIRAQLYAGQILGVVGFNGAGKSTAARTIAGKQQPIGGKSKVHGLPVNEDSIPFRRQVSTVFDEDIFFPSLTVREHLLLVARGHGVADPEGGVDAELEFFALTSRSDAVPGALSSGQRRRLMLAAGLVRPSSLLILDEPEQRLDPVMRWRVAQRLRSYADAGGGVLLVTHDPDVLESTADSCLLIDEEVRVLTAEQAAKDIAGR
ncbi:ABC transporter ATP-binding protein [Arthrobacter sp. H14]|uniref:ABC transporter ATP-binding protein n=1 Tax=Arthrobacter sp. H14 TaxID=1312959 RepID=UPI0004794DFC|nr:ABC transporter ATP-binding protein [Arthrobacter sp. H14]